MSERHIKEHTCQVIARSFPLGIICQISPQSLDLKTGSDPEAEKGSFLFNGTPVLSFCSAILPLFKLCVVSNAHIGLNRLQRSLWLPLWYSRSLWKLWQCPGSRRLSLGLCCLRDLLSQWPSESHALWSPSDFHLSLQKRVITEVSALTNDGSPAPASSLWPVWMACLCSGSSGVWLSDGQNTDSCSVSVPACSLSWAFRSFFCYLLPEFSLTIVWTTFLGF